MASGLYDAGRKAFADKEIDITNDTIKCALIDTGAGGYAVDLATHDFLDDVSGVVGTAVALTNVNNTAGVIGADPTVFGDVEGNSVEALVIYRDSGAAGTSRLIAYIDGISVTPNGGDITVNWATTGDKIFKL